MYNQRNSFHSHFTFGQECSVGRLLDTSEISIMYQKLKKILSTHRLTAVVDPTGCCGVGLGLEAGLVIVDVADAEVELEHEVSLPVFLDCRLLLLDP